MSDDQKAHDIATTVAWMRAEIERLRAEIAKLKSTDMAVALTEMSLRDEITRLRARVEVLEAVLHAIFPDGANIKLVPKANAEEAKP